MASVKKQRKPRIPWEFERSDIPFFGFLLLVTVILVGILILSLKGNLFREIIPKDGATFLFLSVDQASCTVIRSEEGTVMIDTGANASEEVVLAMLAHYGIESLDLIVLTHADEDHAGGLDVILEALPVARVALTEGTRTALSGTYGGDALDRAESAGSTEVSAVAQGDGFTVGAIDVEVLAPNGTDALLPEGGNALSLILLVTYGETDAIFTGDADAEGELRALKVLRHGHAERSFEILAVGHHGSAKSSGEEFLEFLSPEYAVISCGKNNSYGHPAAVVLERLNAVGATVCRTDRGGTVILHTDGTKVTRLR